MRIIDAEPSHCAGITEIYNDAVLHSTATWNETTVDAENRRAWLSAQWEQANPVLVCLDAGGEVAGYATFAQWRAWDGYRFTVEHSVYVRADHRGCGVGGALMRELIERARRLGKHIMIAGIESGNAASIAMHERLGFEICGSLPQVGAKFGSWLDLTFLQLRLDGRIAPHS